MAEGQPDHYREFASIDSVEAARAIKRASMKFYRSRAFGEQSQKIAFYEILALWLGGRRRSRPPSTA